jgi:ABC-2 type transport system ATP-binding protein
MPPSSSTPPAAEAAIRATGLTKRFGTLVAVDGLDLEVAPGEAFALVGPDGAGKTTTMRLLCGIMDPDGGGAQVLGLDTVGEAEAIKERIGYIPQRFGLYGDLTVAENIDFYADLYRVPRAERAERVAELLAFSNLTAFQSRLAANLSGGMKQKLGLVCALVHTPTLLFLDEPTAGVDPVSRREFWQILYRLLAQGLTIFLATSYLDEAERAHRVGLIYRGRLLRVDTPRALKATFEGDLLEVRRTDLRRARQVLTGNPAVSDTLAMGDRLMLFVESAERARGPVEEALRGAGLTDARIAPAEPSLEDLFVQVMRGEEQP